MAPKIPVIYQLPNVHKNKDIPLGRPIFSRINSIYCSIGEYLDIFLHPLAEKGRAFLKDGKEIKTLLRNISINGLALLVTADVE